MKLKAMLNNWLKNVIVTLQGKNSLMPHNGFATYAYGLPKLHKMHIPLRHIVSNVNAPTYNLSKYLPTILSNVVRKSMANVGNSWLFREFIKEQVARKNYCRISLDVISLYPNISTELALNCIRDRWNEISVHATLDKKEFCEGVEFCIKLKILHFQF